MRLPNPLLHVLFTKGYFLYFFNRRNMLCNSAVKKTRKNGKGKISMRKFRKQNIINKLSQHNLKSRQSNFYFTNHAQNGLGM